MYVNNSSFSVGSTSISLPNLSASQTLVDTYIAILNTRLTLNDVIERAGLHYTFEQVRGMIDAKAVNGTEIFEVIVTSKNPEETERIANTIVKVLPVVNSLSVWTADLAVVLGKRHSPRYPKFSLKLGLRFPDLYLRECYAIIIEK